MEALQQRTPIYDRLNALPHKVAAPFRSLLAREHISHDVMHDVFDACELGGHFEHALGFSVAYMYLSKTAPVSDTIRMARQQNRHVNMAWGARRWKEEHDRLARAATLTQLALANESFDVCKYEKLLPPFKGYLIRNSRRLGMEGLRQRHCVASYKSSLMNGSTAIAVVFINKVRWTVSLRCVSGTGDKLNDERLVIGSIKAKYNRDPSNEVREIIHEMLSIEMDVVQQCLQSSQHEFSFKENLRNVLPVLRANQLIEVRVCFCGSGDSGSIEDVSYDPAGFDDQVNTARCVSLASVFEEGVGWVKRETVEEMSIRNVIEELTYDWLEESNINWFDGSGGYGDLVLNVEEGTVNLVVNSTYEESSCEYDTTLNINNGEEI